MYGYGSVLAARNAFEYGETAISIDLLLYPKKSSRHGSSSTSTPQNIVEALTELAVNRQVTRTKL